MEPLRHIHTYTQTRAQHGQQANKQYKHNHHHQLSQWVGVLRLNLYREFKCVSFFLQIFISLVLDWIEAPYHDDWREFNNFNVTHIMAMMECSHVNGQCHEVSERERESVYLPENGKWIDWIGCVRFDLHLIFVGLGFGETRARIHWPPPPISEIYWETTHTHTRTDRDDRREISVHIENRIYLFNGLRVCVRVCVCVYIFLFNIFRCVLCV